jgi:hypothetical protein
MNANTFRFVAPSDADLTGYTFEYYFPGLADLATATSAQLQAAYLGPDADGIGVEWECADDADSNT